MSVIQRCALGGVCGLLLLSSYSLLTANPNNEENLNKFVRGDTNNDGKMDISDAVFMLNYLFNGGKSPPCNPVADINSDGKTNISDAVFLLRHLFMGGEQPPQPFPACGNDPSGAPCPAANCNPSS